MPACKYVYLYIMMPNDVEVDDEGSSLSDDLSQKSHNSINESWIQSQPIPNLEELSKDETMIDKFNSVIQKRENMVKDHIDKIIEFSHHLFLSTQNLHKYSINKSTPRQIVLSNDSHVAIEKLIKDCDKYITTSKQNIKTEIFKLEFDKYLIEKIKKVNDIDPHSNDRKFFELVYNHNIDYLRDRGIKLDSDDSHMMLLKELLEAIEKLRANDTIGLRVGMNKLLTEFLYKDFHTKFPTAVAYFCRKFLNGLKTVKKENDRLFNLEARKKQMTVTFNEMKVKIDASTLKFNSNFIKFSDAFLDSRTDAGKDILLENGTLKFQSSFENAASKGFDDFFQKNWVDHLRDISGHFYYFMGIISKSLLDFDFPFEKYRKLALLSKQQIRNNYQKIFQNILLIFVIFVNRKKKFLSLKYYNENTVQDFLQYEKEYNILLEENFTAHSYFIEKYLKDTDKTKFEFRRSKTFGQPESDRSFVQLETVLSTSSSSNILFGEVKANEVLLLISTLLYNKPEEYLSTDETEAICSLDYLFKTLCEVYHFSNETEVKSQIRDYMKLIKKNLRKLQNDEFLRHEVKLIDLKKELETNYGYLKETFALITKSSVFKLFDHVEKIYINSSGNFTSPIAEAHRSKQQHL
jgi:hypothetical protein